MKRAVLLLALIFAFAALPGCGAGGGGEAGVITVKVDGQVIELSEIDVETDTLLGRALSEDVPYETESGIFAPLIGLNEGLAMPLGVTIEVGGLAQYESVVIYDHLLKEDGTSYFNRSLDVYQFDPVGDAVKVTLNGHTSTALSSNAQFLDDGSLRGFRIILRRAAELVEYAFVLHVL